MRVWFIYALIDPRTGAPRYVGVSHDPQRRLREHLFARRATHCATWIRSLRAAGLAPVLSLLEEGRGDWTEAERTWIAYYRALGADLTNHTDGGEGTPGWSPSPVQRAQIGVRTKAIHTGLRRSKAARANMAAAQLARIAWEREAGIIRTKSPVTEATRAKLAAAQTGKRASKASRARMSASRRNPSEATREKLRVAVLKRPAAQRAAFAKNQLGTKKSEETRARMADARRRWWAKKKGITDGST